jgi:hypothetical protein
MIIYLHIQNFSPSGNVKSKDLVPYRVKFLGDVFSFLGFFAELHDDIGIGFSCDIHGHEVPALNYSHLQQRFLVQPVFINAFPLFLLLQFLHSLIFSLLVRQ